METIKAIKRRKSTRNFKGDLIAQEKLDLILGAGCAAPVGMGNYDGLHISVVRDSSMRDAIADTTAKLMQMDSDPTYHAPTLVVVSAQPNDKAPGIEYANASCVAQNMMLAATDCAVESIYLWGAAKAIEKFADKFRLLGIPGGFTPIVVVGLGYAVETNDTEKELKNTINITVV